MDAPTTPQHADAGAGGELFELAAVPMWLTDAEGRVLDVNSAAAAMLGYDRAALLRLTLRELVHPDDYAHRGRDLPRLLTGEPVVARRRLRHRDGHWVVAEGRGRADARGRVITIVQDVGELERAYQAVAASEREFRAIFELAASGKAQADPVTRRFQRVNPKLCEITGYSEEELVGMTDLDITHPDDRERDGEAIAAAHREPHAGWTSEKRYLTKSGQIRWVIVTGRLMRDDDGRPLRTVATIHDITDRKRAEEAVRRLNAALRSRVEELQALVDENPVGIAIAGDPACREVRVNRALAEMLGTAPGAGLEDPPPHRFLKAGREVEPRDLPMQRCVASGAPVDADELQVVRADGTQRSLLNGARPLFDDHGKVRGCVSFCVDITDRARAADAVRAERAFLRKVIDADTSLILVKDAANRFVLANETAARLFGTTVEDLVGKSDRDFVPLDAAGELPAEYRAMYASEQEAIRTRTPLRHEFELRDPAGRRHWFSATKVPLVDERGGCDQLLVVATDLTERRRMEESLRDADRRKDDFLAMLSHELRNPLAPVRNSIHILNRADPASDAARRARAVIERQVEHITRLVDDLLDVTRIGRGKIEIRRETLDLAELARRAAEDLSSVMEQRALRLRVEVAPAPVWVEGDATRLAQVIGNLLHNAAKFTPAGGEVRLEVAVRGGAAELRLEDTGVGVAADVLERIFEPFVQAKQPLARTQGGLGLGLALVKGIVELHGGTVRASSAGEDRGTAIVAALPLACAPARLRADGCAAARPGHAKRVLIVDDNVDAAESLAELVRLFGHEPEVVYDGAAALERARSRRPDVVLCDIGLPGLTGYDVARGLRLAGLRGARIVAVTGYTSPEDRARATAAGFDDHVAKPPRPDELARLLS